MCDMLCSASASVFSVSVLARLRQSRLSGITEVQAVSIFREESCGRRDFLRLGGAALLAAGVTRTVEAAPVPRKPNFLFLFTDDQSFRTVNALNNPEVRTPNLDRLVRRGVTFTHCYNQGSWSGAVCICSRAMLNTGQFIYHARRNMGAAPLWGETLGHAGYETFLTGKWHNGEKSALRSFARGRAVGAGMYGARNAYDRPGKEGEERV